MVCSPRGIEGVLLCFCFVEGLRGCLGFLLSWDVLSVFFFFFLKKGIWVENSKNGVVSWI